MAYFVCIAIGQGDFSPHRQEYLSAGSTRELRSIVARACRDWEAEERADNPRGKIYRYPFRAPSTPSVTNWSQRLRIGSASDWVLDVIGMTEAEFERESA